MDSDLAIAERTILSQFLAILAGTASMKLGLEKALETIITCPWLPIKPKAGIFLCDPKNQNNIELYVTTKNFSPELLSLCSKVKYGHCICGRAASTQKIIFVDCVNELHENHFEGMTEHGHYSVPFFDDKRELLGVLVLYVEHGHQSTDHELIFLECISNALGALVQKYRLGEVVEKLDRAQTVAAMAATLGHEINNPLAIAFAVHSSCATDKPLSSKNHDRMGTALQRIHGVVKKIQKLKTDDISFSPYSGTNSNIIKLDKDNSDTDSD